MIGARVLVLATAVAAVPFAAVAQEAIDDVAVYIRCTADGQPPREGSGVLISQDGMVLTAAHVVFAEDGTRPTGWACEGSIGNRNIAKANLTFKVRSQIYDAAIVKYPGLGHPFLQYCRMEPWMRRQQVNATGFPLETVTELPSSRVGILSNVEPQDGVVEATINATAGMSGGPVTLPAGDQLLGIVNGADVDLTSGLRRSDRVTPAFLLRNEFSDWGLTEFPDCVAEKPPSVEELLEIITALQASTSQLNDHPQRLSDAERKLIDVERSLEWTASVTETPGDLTIRYRKIISGDLKVDWIDAKIDVFTREFLGDGIVARHAKTLYPDLNADQRGRLNNIREKTDSGGEFFIDKFFDNVIVDKLVSPFKETFDTSYAITELRITFTPMFESTDAPPRKGETREVELLISQSKWERLYGNFASND